MSRTPKREQIVRAKLRITRIAPRETASGLRPKRPLHGPLVPNGNSDEGRLPASFAGEARAVHAGGFFLCRMLGGLPLGQ